jgi:hypothetical protein
MTDSREERVALEPCPTPWCDGKGGEPYVFERRRDVLGVYCPSCGVTTPYLPTQEEAVAIWNDRPALEPSPDVSRESEWQPIETAKRDGTPVLVKLRDDIYPGLRPERADLKGWNGITAVMRNRGDPSDWCFAAPVGHGGFPDEWMVGWKHTDPPKATTEGEE